MTWILDVDLMQGCDTIPMPNELSVQPKYSIGMVAHMGIQSVSFGLRVFSLQAEGPRRSNLRRVLASVRGRLSNFGDIQTRSVLLKIEGID